MSDELTITVDSVRRMRLEPGDTVVLSTTEYLDQSETNQLKAKAQALFPGYNVVVLAGGIELSVAGR